MLETQRGEDRGGGAAAYSGAAHDYDFAVFQVLEFARLIRQDSQRNRSAARNVSEFVVVLLCFAHVEHDRRGAAGEAVPQFGNACLMNAAQLRDIGEFDGVVFDRGLIGLQCLLNLVGSGRPRLFMMLMYSSRVWPATRGLVAFSFPIVEHRLPR